MRFIQLDVATKDDRAENGWIFGTFVYDGRNLVSCGLVGTSSLTPVSNFQEDFQPVLDMIPDPGWHRVLPVGLMWGNDPLLTQAKFDKEGLRPVEQWINPAADELLSQLKGSRPSWGWNGRLNG